MGVVIVILPLVAFAPTLLRPVFNLWLKIAHAIGWFNTQVLLTIVFILVFIPTGLIMRLFRKDPMKRKMVAEGSYWEPYELEGLKDRNLDKNGEYLNCIECNYRLKPNERWSEVCLDCSIKSDD